MSQVAKKRLFLICDAFKEQRTAHNQKDRPVFMKPYFIE